MPFDGTDFIVETETIERQRVQELRNFLAILPAHKFHMAIWQKDLEELGCNTVACIGGWAETLFQKECEKATFLEDNQGWAGVADVLGLTYKEADALFQPNGYRFMKWTPSQAVAVLDHYLATGQIDWSVA